MTRLLGDCRHSSVEASVLFIVHQVLASGVGDLMKGRRVFCLKKQGARGIRRRKND